MASKVKIVSINIRGLNNQIKKKRFLSLLQKINADVVMVQETHLRKAIDFIASRKRYPYQLLAAGSSKARGVAILLRNSVRFEEVARYKDPKGRFAFIKGKLNNELVTLASVYAPNDGQIPFLDAVFAKLTSWGEGLWLVAGDMNYVSDLAKDRTYRHGLHEVLRDETPYTYCLRSTTCSTVGENYT